jgi:hypothetical protein
MRGGQWSRSFCSPHLEVFGGWHPVREGSRTGNLQTLGWLNHSLDGLSYTSTLSSSLQSAYCTLCAYYPSLATNGVRGDRSASCAG